MASNCIVISYFPSACVLMLITVCLRDDRQFCLSHVKLLHNLQLFTREDAQTLSLKDISVIDESVHVAVGLQLLEMSSITKLNQTILNVCTGTFFRAFF